MVFLIVAFVLFSAALFGVARYVWAMPQPVASRDVGVRLRELRDAWRKAAKAASLSLSSNVHAKFGGPIQFVSQIGLLRHAEVSI